MDSAQLTLDVGLPDRDTFSNFFTGNNSSLIRALRQIAEGGGEEQIALWGGAGSGKSHLLHAVCRHAVDHGLQVQYLPLSVLAEQPPPEALITLASNEVLCIDELDTVFGDAAWETALFNLINACRDQNCRLVLALCDNPNYANVSLPDLASRLLWGPVFQLRQLGDEEKLVALVERAERRGFELPIEVAEYLLRHTARDLGSLMQCLEKIDEASLVKKRKVTVPFVRALFAG